MVTDNGPPFSGQLLERFCARHNINLLHAPPYNPEGNGLSEKAVQIINIGFK